MRYVIAARHLFGDEKELNLSVKPENYEAIVAAINAKYEGELRRGNEIIRLPSISTGSPELDVAMGGGVPQGRFTRFYGGYGSTKTMTAYSVISEAQKQGLLCAYYNIERRYEADFAKACGINTKELTLVEGVTIEGIVDKMESLLGVCHLHVLDSCTMADSEDELAADIRDWRPALLARVWGKGFRRINEHFDHLDNTVILIDQMRMKKKGGGRSMELVEDPAGGQVFDFMSSMSVHFKVGAWLWRAEEGGFVDSNSKKTLESGREDSIDKQMQPQGREIKIRVEKSSVCRPFRTATLHYDLDSLQYDRVYEYVKAGLYYNIIHQTSNGRYQYVDGDDEVTKMHGMGQLRKFIEDHPDIQEYIHQVALESNFRDNEA